MAHTIVGATWGGPAPTPDSWTVGWRLVGISNRGAGDGLGFRFLWIHPFEWLKSNIGTILILPNSGRLRFPRNIWVGAGGG